MRDEMVIYLMLLLASDMAETVKCRLNSTNSKGWFSLENLIPCMSIT
jgi:hypothetical protein